jgi:hypothetical protein
MEGDEPKLPCQVCQGCKEILTLHDYPFHSWACRNLYLMGLENCAYCNFKRGYTLKYPEMIEEMKLYYIEPKTRHPSSMGPTSTIIVNSAWRSII